MGRRVVHMCLDVQGGINNAKLLKGAITVDGKRLDTIKEVKAFLYGQLALGRRVIPCCDCDNFDYQKGCLGHAVADESEDTE